MIVTIVVGVLCAGVFFLLGPIGIVIIGLMLALAGVSSSNKND